jgi:hypothetical protein
VVISSEISEISARIRGGKKKHTQFSMASFPADHGSISPPSSPANLKQSTTQPLIQQTLPGAKSVDATGPTTPVSSSSSSGSCSETSNDREATTPGRRKKPASTSLPYDGDIQEAMRKQDRSAIRILMQHQQHQQHEQASEEGVSQASSSTPSRLLRQSTVCPCSLNCGDNSREDLVQLPSCDHEMHAECLEGLLLTRASTCPLCRSSIESLRTSLHYAEIDREIEESWQVDLARAIEMSASSAEGGGSTYGGE